MTLSDDLDDEDGGVGTWTTWSTEHERVRAVALAADQPRPAWWVADQAVVSSERATEVLSELVNSGELIRIDEDDGRDTWRADPGWVTSELSDMLRDHDRDGLIDLRDDMEDRLEACDDPTVCRLLEFRLGLLEDELDAPRIGDE